MSIFVGIDQALRKIGVAVLREDHVDLLHLITPPEDLRDAERLRYLEESLQYTLEPYPQITGVAMEGQSYGSRGQLDQLGQVIGVVKLFLHRKYNCTPLTVPPTTLKKFVAGDGHASKASMMQATQRYWKELITQDDLCDAHGLARVAYAFHTATATTRHQLEAIQSLKNPKKRRKRIKKIFPPTL